MFNPLWKPHNFVPASIGGVNFKSIRAGTGACELILVESIYLW